MNDKENNQRGKTTTMIFDEDTLDSLDAIRDKLIYPVVGKHSRTMAIRFAISYCYKHGVLTEKGLYTK